MAFDRAAAKQAGYTDEEIDAYLQSKKITEPMTDSAAANEPPAPTTQIQSADAGIAAEATTLGAAVAPYALPAAATAIGLGAAAYGAGKVGGWGRNVADTAKQAMESYRHGVNTANEIARQNVELQKERIAERQARGAPQPQAARAAGPVAPSQIINPATGQPFAPAQAAPQAAPAQQALSREAQQYLQSRAMPQTMAAPQAAPQTMLDKTTQMMKQIAANKVLQNTLRLGGAAAFAAQHSDLGPAVPQKGPYRGMEINPMTRRPWTREELAAINR